jgi:acetyltransferase-like isoleucine patch superfamily enzyme
MDVRGFLRWLPFRLGYVWGPRLMSRLRRRWVYLRHPHANLLIHPTAYLGPGFSLHITGPATFECGPYCQFRRNFRAELEGRAHVRFGEKCVATYDVLMQCSTSIELGDRVMLGQNTFLADGNHNFRDLDKPMLAQGYEYRPLKLGDDAVATSKCTILADLGERAYVGANAVVTKPIPPFCVAVGSPARAIDYFGPPGLEPPELAARSARS